VYILIFLWSIAGNWGGDHGVPQRVKDRLGACLARSDRALRLTGLLDEGYSPSHYFRTEGDQPFIVFLSFCTFLYILNYSGLSYRRSLPVQPSSFPLMYSVVVTFKSLNPTLIPLKVTSL